MVGLFCGCAVPLGVVAFVVTFVAWLFDGTMSMRERFAAAAMTGVMASVAGLILGVRDQLRFRAAIRKVRQHLLERPDFEEYGSVPDSDREHILLVRRAVAEFFAVPATKIRASDNMRNELGSDFVDPALHYFVWSWLLREGWIPQSVPIPYATGTYETVGEFAIHFRNLLKNGHDDPL